MVRPVLSPILMTKVQSGLTLVAIGIMMNIVGRVIISHINGNHNVALASFMAVWMIASAVVPLFGLFRIVMGLRSKNQT